MLYLIIIVVRNILEPKLAEKQIGLHPLIMLIRIYVGVRVFGFIGLFALPIIAMIVKYLYITANCISTMSQHDTASYFILNGE